MIIVPRKLSLWVGRSVEDETDGKPPRFRFLRWLRCRHEKTVRFGWIDHAAGSGWMSDSYVADICDHCGKAVKVQKTY